MRTGPHTQIIADPNSPDPVCAAVDAWRAEKARQDELQLQWQNHEHALLARCKSLGVDFTRACRSNSDDVRAMRTLMRAIEQLDQTLGQRARSIIAMGATSPAGALALIELGLTIQAPNDCEEHAWALLRHGADQMRSMLKL